MRSTAITPKQTFFGKAASVMRRKGCACVSTIHHLAYRPAGDPSPEQNGEEEFVVIDERSFVDRRVGADLELPGALVFREAHMKPSAQPIVSASTLSVKPPYYMHPAAFERGRP